MYFDAAVVFVTKFFLALAILCYGAFLMHPFTFDTITCKKYYFINKYISIFKLKESLIQGMLHLSTLIFRCDIHKNL